MRDRKSKRLPSDDIKIGSKKRYIMQRDTKKIFLRRSKVQKTDRNQKSTNSYHIDSLKPPISRTYTKKL